MNFKKYKRLLFVTFFLLTSVPLFLLGYVDKKNSEEAIRERAAAHLASVAEKGSQLVQGFFSERLNDIRLLADSLLPSDMESEALLSERLSLVKHQYGVYSDLLIIDKNGNSVATSGETNLQGLNFSREDWFTRSITGAEHRGEVFLGSDGETPMLLVSVPVLDPSATRPSAVLVGIIELKFIEKLFSRTEIQQTGEIYLVDGKGRFLTSTRFGVKPLLQRIDIDRYKRRCSKFSSCVQDDYRGEKVLSVGRNLHEMGWTVIADQDWKEIQRPLNQNQRQFLVGGSIILIVVMLVAWVASSRVSRILERLYKHEKNLEIQVLQQEKLVSMGLLTAGMAHELNTPIANALLYTQLLVEEFSNLKDGSDHLKMLKTVEEEIQQVGRIVRNLLEFSRRPQSDEKDADIHYILNKLLEIAKIEETYPSVEINLNFQNDIPHALADPSILKQVFGNLVTNALDAMPDGGKLRISTRYVTALKKIKIEFSDTGKGIAAEDLGRVFQPFFTTKNSDNGVGLGLFVGYGMIRRMGGNIRVFSVHKKDPKDATPCGTTFTVELPTSNIPEEKPPTSKREGGMK